MELISDMDGNQPTFHSHVHVVNLLTLLTRFTVQMFDTPTWGTMKSEIPLPTSWARFALMLKSSRNFSRCKARALSSIQPQLMRRLTRCKSKRNMYSRFSRTFFDVKVFNTQAKTSRRLLKDAYKNHDALKNSKCQQRVLHVERAASARSFLAALVVPHQQLHGQCSAYLENLVKKGHESYSETINYKRTKINFERYPLYTGVQITP